MNKKSFYDLNDNSFWGNEDDSDDGSSMDEKQRMEVFDEQEAADDKNAVDLEGEWTDVKDRSHHHHSRAAFRRKAQQISATKNSPNRLSDGRGVLSPQPPILSPPCITRHPTATSHQINSFALGGFPSTPCGGFSRPSFAPTMSRHFTLMEERTSSSKIHPNPFAPLPQTSDASGFGAGLSRFKRSNDGLKHESNEYPFASHLEPFHPDLEDSPLCGSIDDLRSAHSMGTLLTPNFRTDHKANEQQQLEKKPATVNLMDEENVEYYEFLCQGIQKLLESGIPLAFDCEGRFNPESSSICAALKSNYYFQYNPGRELFSRKVFVGGLPIDINEEDLISSFSTFGPLSVDWPSKNETKSYFPPKGYVFLIFKYEMSVRALVHRCITEDEKLFFYISRPNISEKLVQIRPWRLADADYLVDVNVPINPKRVVFVGGVPRPIRAVELAHIMDRLYGSVSCAGIDTDIRYKYPKGAGRVAFTNYKSYIQAITDRYAHLKHGEIEKAVEMKPYVLDDQKCEECRAHHAPFFCPDLECLQYYCEGCWTLMHGCMSREDHKPFVKEA